MCCRASVVAEGEAAQVDEYRCGFGPGGETDPKPGSADGWTGSAGSKTARGIRVSDRLDLVSAC